MKGKSLRGAIDAKCKDCIYDPLAGGTWKEQVHLCTARTCGLWPVRPRSESARLAAYDEADPSQDTRTTDDLLEVAGKARNAALEATS